jgi:hypothetical protein
MRASKRLRARLDASIALTGQQAITNSIVAHSSSSSAPGGLGVA